VVHRKRDDTQVTGLIDDAILPELLDCDCHVLARELFVLDADLDVAGISRFEMLHQRPCPDGADHLERSPAISEMRAEPTRQPEIGNANRVIRMKMGEEQCVDSPDGHSKLKQAHGCATPSIDQEDLIARLDQCARTKTVGAGDRHPRPEECYAKSSHYGCTFISASATTFFQCAT
jgi:hypothetical protein